MELEELIGVLREKGALLANIIFIKSSSRLELLNCLYGGRLCESIEKTGLGQRSANFGDVRQILVEEALNEIGVESSVFDGVLDLLMCKKYDGEVKGSFTHAFKKNYNNPIGGKLHISYDKRLHFLLQHKIEFCQNVSPIFTSMRLTIAYMDSSMFENVDSAKQNRSVLSISRLKKNYADCIIGEWEVFKN